DSVTDYRGRSEPRRMIPTEIEGKEMRTHIWDKAALLHNTQAFIEHLVRLEAHGCHWLVVPFTAEESFGSFKCSKCDSDTGLAAVYSIATHVAFEEEVLRAIEASSSQAEYELQVSRVIEEEG